MKKRDDFPDKKHVVLPVIHVSNVNQAIANAFIAKRAGCDGIFLINHGITYGDLICSYQAVRRLFPDWWIGLNFLDRLPEEIFGIIPQDVSAIWIDNAMINIHTRNQDYAELISKQRKRSDWQGMYFGGIAFKYQEAVPDNKLERITETAAHYMDVITTSGSETGIPPNPQKIQRMSNVWKGKIPLAIASGISSENIHLYPDCKFFLVATSIGRNFYNLDLELTKKLVELARL